MYFDAMYIIMYFVYIYVIFINKINHFEFISPCWIVLKISPSESFRGTDFQYKLKVHSVNEPFPG